MSNEVIIAHLSKYGDLVAGSLQRGKIKGTEIDKGTRYIKILNCVPRLPLRDQIGRFQIRLFADNNRTPCRFCDETSHPCYKCPNKENLIKCWQCGGNHHKKDCTSQNYEKNNADAESNWGDTEATDRQQVNDVSQQTPGTNDAAGNDTDDSAGNDTDDDSSVTPGQRQGQKPSDASEYSQTLHDLLYDHKLKVIISDSNGCRLRVSDRNVTNVSVSGAKFDDVQSLIDKCDDKDVGSVAVHLGTNDVKSCDSTATVIQQAINSLECIHKKWPGAEIAYSSILPRIGKGNVVKRFNKNAASVNNAILQNCQASAKFRYIDNSVLFHEEGTTHINKSLYNTNDPAGIHVNEEGARALYRNLTAFLIDEMSDENDLELGRSKRLRSDDSSTSQEQRFAKQGKGDMN